MSVEKLAEEYAKNKFGESFFCQDEYEEARESYTVGYKAGEANALRWRGAMTEPPEEGAEVFANCGDGIYIVAEFSEGFFSCVTDERLYEVIEWMPIPGREK